MAAHIVPENWCCPASTNLSSQNPVLAAQWDTERNGTLTPQQVTLTSNRKAWWICEGHSFSGSDCVPRKRDRLPVLHESKGAGRLQ
ncbi:MAG: zinc-ribbon domain-containing protein [Sutterella seckii]